MTNWTTPENRARLRKLCAGNGDDAHLVVEAMPAVLDALEQAEVTADLQCRWALVLADVIDSARDRAAIAHERRGGNERSE